MACCSDYFEFKSAVLEFSLSVFFLTSVYAMPIRFAHALTLL